MTTIRLESVSLLVCYFPGLWLGECFSPVKGNYVALILIPDEIRRQEIERDLSGHPFVFFVCVFTFFFFDSVCVNLFVSFDVSASLCVCVTTIRLEFQTPY
jgi:hypothetical protein